MPRSKYKHEMKRKAFVMDGLKVLSACDVVVSTVVTIMNRILYSRHMVAAKVWSQVELSRLNTKIKGNTE